MTQPFPVVCEKSYIIEIKYMEKELQNLWAEDEKN